MKVHQWKVGPNHIYEMSEYVNLGLFSNYCGSFDKNIDKKITNARKKAGMLSSADFNKRIMDSTAYINFCRPGCIPAFFLGQNSGL